MAATMNAATFMGKNSWRRLSLIGDETVINLQSTKSLCLLGFCVVPREDPSTS